MTNDVGIMVRFSFVASTTAEEGFFKKALIMDSAI